MKMQFSDVEGRALHGLLQDASNDIVVRLDSAGFVLHASENAAELGMDLSALLLMPHISDFAEPDYRDRIADLFGRMIASPKTVRHGPNADMRSPRQRGEWIEFPVLTCGSDVCEEPDLHRRWYALRFKPIESADGTAQGALGLLRSIASADRPEDRRDARESTDTLADLGDRCSFTAALGRRLASGSEQSIAILAIDRMQAILLQYGQRTADEIHWGFSRFLSAMVHSPQELSRLDGARFGIVLPGMSPRQAKAWAEEVLRTFAELAMTSSASDPRLSASAGVARLEKSVDATMRQAELALVMARAGGGMRVVNCRDASRSASMAPLPRVVPLPSECPSI